MAQMSTGERLVYMANQIALNFAIAGEDAAALATADHIASFWDPRMKDRIRATAEHPASGLSVIAARAILRLATRGAPPPQSGATIFNEVGEAGGSDAG